MTITMIIDLLPAESPLVTVHNCNITMRLSGTTSVATSALGQTGHQMCLAQGFEPPTFWLLDDPFNPLSPKKMIEVDVCNDV